MVNPYHDAEGKFTSREGMEDAITSAISEGDFDAAKQLEEDYKYATGNLRGGLDGRPTLVAYEPLTLTQLKNAAFETINDTDSRFRVNIPVSLDELLNVSSGEEHALDDVVSEKIIDEYAYIDTDFILLKNLSATPREIIGHQIILDVVGTLTTWAREDE